MGAETLWGDGLVFPLPALVAGDSGAALTAPLPVTATSTTDGALTAPLPTLSSNDGNSARLTAPVPTLTADDFPYALLTAPLPTLSAVMGFESTLTAPVPALDLVYINSAYLTATGTAGLPLLSADGLAGEVFTFANTAPTPELEAGTKDIAETAPVPLLTATAVTGALITATAAAPAPFLTAALTNPAIITAANSAALPQLAAAMTAGNIITAALLARLPRLSAQGLTGQVGTALLTAATPIMAAAGYPAYTLTFAETAPVPQLDATLSTTVTAAYRTWVLNLRKGALTEYDSFAFNSYTVFNGVVLAAGPAGVFALGTQGADAGTAITARVTTGQDAFGSSVHKRVPRLYTGYDTDGDMLFRVITTEGGSRTYSLPDNYVRGIQQRRVPIGKGVKSRYFQFELENVNGADFSISDILAYPTKLRRRVM